MSKKSQALHIVQTVKTIVENCPCGRKHRFAFVVGETPGTRALTVSAILENDFNLQRGETLNFPVKSEDAFTVAEICNRMAGATSELAKELMEAAGFNTETVSKH